MNNSCEKQIEIGIENNNQTVPSCNYCAVTIATKQFPRTAIQSNSRGVGTAFRREIRMLFPRISDSREVSGVNFKRSGDVLN